MPSSTSSGLTGRLLIADDLADAARSLAMLCEMYGADVRVALDGHETLELAEAFRPDVVLMDISMPKLNGYQAAQAIRRAVWGQTMTLIALTGWGGSSDVEKAQAAGFDGHLLKPVDPDAMLQLITELRARRGTL